MTHHSRRATLGFCVIHLFPIIITSILLFLNFSGIYYEPTGVSNQNARLNTLQFAAKLHEVSITLSLSAIVLTYIQFELLQGSGIPLGSLLSAFQVNNLSSLWSPGLWATTFARGLNLRRFLLVAIVILAVTLGAIVGPASAILMVPSLGYWNDQLPVYTQPSWWTNNEKLRYFVCASESSLWPSRINTVDAYPPDCNSTASPMPEYCPLGGFSTLLDLATPLWWEEEGDWNFTIQSPSDSAPGDATLYSQFIEGSSVISTGGGFYSVTGTTSMFANNFLGVIAAQGNMQNINMNEKITLTLINGRVLAPTVYAPCLSLQYQLVNGSFYPSPWSADNLSPAYSSLKEISFPLPQSGYIHQNWTSNLSPLLDIWNSSTVSAAMWVDPPNIGDATPSIGAVFATYYNNSSSAKILTCSVYASWQPVDMYLNTFADNFIHSPTMDEYISNGIGSEYLPLYTQRPIKIDSHWANTEIPGNSTFGELVRKQFALYTNTNSFDDTMCDETAFGSSLTIFLTNVLSRIGGESQPLVGHTISNQNSTYMDWQEITPNPNDTLVEIDPSNMTEFQVTLLRYGYAYSMEGLTRRMAAGILLAHSLVAIIYMVLIVWFRWTCHGLRTLSEVLVLAITSHPSEKLDNTCSGISRLDTYKHILKVREVSDARLGLVLDDENGSLTSPVAGKLYGSKAGR